jgi:hypothetical protein
LDRWLATNVVELGERAGDGGKKGEGRDKARLGVALNVSLGYGKETLHKSTSEMKHKAHGAQEPEHMGYM